MYSSNVGGVTEGLMVEEMEIIVEKNEKPRIQCSNCQMPGPSKENCYKLIGYPSGWKLCDVYRPEAGMFNANRVDVV